VSGELESRSPSPLAPRTHRMERVVITGMGVISPIGSDLASFWKNLLAGQSGIGPITLFDAARYSTRIAGEVRDFDPEQHMDKREARRLERFIQFAVAASKQAVEDADLELAQCGDEVGVIIGSGIGGISIWEREHLKLHQSGPDRISPFLVPMMIGDMASGQVSISLGARGPNTGMIAACASAGFAVQMAAHYIRTGVACAMVTGGTEAAIAGTAVAGFCSIKALSRRNDDPTHASRPFDQDRDGFVMSEGAGVVVLESLSHAVARNARIYCELVGEGASGDAYHITAMDPAGNGAIRAMQQALRQAKLTPDEVTHINAHGTSTELNDKTETLAIKRTFGEERARQIPITSNKSVFGHLLGAAGGVELIASTLTLRDQLIPPTINYTTPDAACDLDYVPNVARPATVDNVLSNSFGFGGHNACLIVQRFES